MFTQTRKLDSVNTLTAWHRITNTTEIDSKLQELIEKKDLTFKNKFFAFNILALQ